MFDKFGYGHADEKDCSWRQRGSDGSSADEFVGFWFLVPTR